MPYQAFAVADGHVIVAVGNDAPVRAALRPARRSPAEDALRDQCRPRASTAKRLVALLAPAIALRRRDELLAALAAAGIPAGPINDVAEVFADPQVIARGMRIDPGGVPGVASPIVIDGRRQVAERASPPKAAPQEPDFIRKWLANRDLHPAASCYIGGIARFARVKSPNGALLMKSLVVALSLLALSAPGSRADVRQAPAARPCPIFRFRARRATRTIPATSTRRASG